MEAMIVHTRPLCLSPRRLAVLVALYRLARPRGWGLGYSPTIRELRWALGYRSNCGVTHQLGMLAREGLVTREYDRYVSGTRASRAWRPSKRLLFITQGGVTVVRERLHAATGQRLQGNEQ